MFSKCLYSVFGARGAESNTMADENEVLPPVGEGDGNVPQVVDQNQQMADILKNFKLMQEQNAAMQAELNRMKEQNEPRAPASHRITTQTTIKTPKLGPGMTLKEYKTKIAIWRTTANIPKSQQAVLLIEELPKEDKYGGLYKHIIDHIGEENLGHEDAIDKMMTKMEEFLQESKLIRGVNWLLNITGFKQKESWELTRYFATLEELFKEANDDFACEIPDFLKACWALSACTSISEEGLGHIMQQIDTETLIGQNALYGEIKKVMKRQEIATKALHGRNINRVGISKRDWTGANIRTPSEEAEDGVNEALVGRKKYSYKGPPGYAGQIPNKIPKYTRQQCIEKGLCFNCFKIGHGSMECEAPRRERPERTPEELEILKQKVLRAKKVWDNRTNPPSFTHPDGKIYSYRDPVHQAKTHGSFTASLSSHPTARQPSATVTSAQAAAADPIQTRPPIRVTMDNLRNFLNRSEQNRTAPVVAETPSGDIQLEVGDEDLFDLSEYDSYNTFMGELYMDVENVINVKFSGTRPGQAIVDTGCQKTCANAEWVDNYVKNLPEVFRDKVKQKPSQNKFKFGNPQVYKSLKYVLLPVKIGSQIKLLGTDVVEADIPLLLSRENFKNLGMKITFTKGQDQANYIEIEGENRKFPMQQIGGHDWLDLMPGMDDIPVDTVQQILANNTGADRDDRNLRKKYSDDVQKLHIQMACPPMAKMESMLKTGGNWRDFSKEVLLNIYKNCPSKDCRARLYCQKTKKVAWRQVEKMGDLVAMDLKISEGSEANILYMVDVATSYVLAVVIENKTPAHIAQKIFEKWYGNSYPRIKQIITDNGLEFTGGPMVEFMQYMNIKHKTSVALTPEQNGVCERIHAVCDRNISKLRETGQLSLKEALVWAVWAYNSTELVTGYSPKQLVYGINDEFTRTIDMAPTQMQDFEKIPISLAEQIVARETCIANHLQIKASLKMKEMLRRKLVPSRERKEIGQWVYFKRSQESRWRGPGQICHGLGNDLNVKCGGKYFTCRQDDVIPLTENELKQLKPDSEEETGSREERDSEVGQHVITTESNSSVQVEPQGDSIRDGARETETGANTGAGESSEQVVSHDTPHNDTDLSTQEQITVGDTAVETEEPAAAEQTAPPVRRGRKKVSAKSKTLPPAQYQKGHRVKYQDKKAVWRQGQVVQRASKLTQRTGEDWYDVDTEGGGRVRIRAQDWYDVQQQEQQENILLQSIQENEGLYDALTVQQGETHSVKVSQVPYFLHNTEEAKVAKNKQMEKINQFGAFKDVSIDDLDDVQKRKIIPSTWALVYKNIDGKQQMKARLCARGDREIQPNRTDCPTASKPSIRVILSLAATNCWKINSLDFTAAFLQSEEIERELYLSPPKDIRDKNPKLLWRVVKRIYGLKDASRGWYKELDKALRKLGCEVSLCDKSAYVMKDSKGNIIGAAAVHIDDILYAGTPFFLKNVIQKLIDNYVVGSVESEQFTFTGWDLKQTQAGIELTQTSFAERIDLKKYDDIRLHDGKNDELLSDRLQQMFRSMVGTIGWCSQVSRPDRAVHSVHLGIKLGKATVGDAKLALRVIKNLRDSPQVIKFSNLGNIQDCKIVSWADSSYGKSEPGQTVNGVVTFLHGSNGKMNVLDWTSHKLDVPVASPLAGECEAALEAYSRIKWMRSLIKDILGIEDMSAIIRTDSKSLTDSVASSSQVKDKRAMVGISTLRAIPEFDGTRLEWIPGKLNLADHLTKTTTNAEQLRDVLQDGTALQGAGI